MHEISLSNLLNFNICLTVCLIHNAFCHIPVPTIGIGIRDIQALEEKNWGGILTYWEDWRCMREGWGDLGEVSADDNRPLIKVLSSMQTKVSLKQW